MEKGVFYDKKLNIGCKMAESRHSSLLLEKKKSNQSDTFEMIVKNRLGWTREKWEEEGLEDTRFHKLVNSMKYWSKKLLNAQGELNVILTAYNADKNITLYLQDILTAIEALDKDIVIRGYADFRNPRYLSIAFETQEVKQFVEKNLKFIGENNVVFLSWAQHPTEQNIRVSWLPNDIDISLVKEALSNFFVITEENNVVTTMLSGRKLLSAKIDFKGILKKGVTLEEVPHLIMIYGLECLVTIMGRKYLCLNCNVLGHKAYNCPTPYCSKCRSLKLKGHDCLKFSENSQTYAQKVKGKFLSSEKGLLDEQENRIIINTTEVNRGKLSTINDSSVSNRSKINAESVRMASLKKSETSEIVVNNNNSNSRKEKKEKNKRKARRRGGGDELIAQVNICPESDGDLTSDDSLSDLGSDEDQLSKNKLYENMESYFSELEKLKLPGNNCLEKEQKRKETKDGNEQKMESTEFSLKRKIETNSPTNMMSTRGALGRKTYGRRRGRPPAPGDNLFNLLVENVDNG